MASTELEVRKAEPPVTHDLRGLERLAIACAKSGYFKDATDAAKAYVKVVAGAELGVGPVQAMTGIHIVQGKPTLSASLVGALIKRSGRYDYRVKSHSDSECTLTFFENGEPVGESSFGINDAKAAGLTNNPTWKSYPRNMLLSRALTNGARWYCPDVFGGAVYTPDELGATVDGEGEVVSLPAAMEPLATAPEGEHPETVHGGRNADESRAPAPAPGEEIGPAEGSPLRDEEESALTAERGAVRTVGGANTYGNCPNCGHPLKRKRDGSFFCAKGDGGCGKGFAADDLRLTNSPGGGDDSLSSTDSSLDAAAHGSEEPPGEDSEQQVLA